MFEGLAMILQAWISVFGQYFLIKTCPYGRAFWQCCSKIGLLNRKQNDSKALLELDTSLRLLDPELKNMILPCLD
jgi:hypothetical protein